MQGERVVFVCAEVDMVANSAGRCWYGLPKHASAPDLLECDDRFKYTDTMIVENLPGVSPEEL